MSTSTLTALTGRLSKGRTFDTWPTPATDFANSSPVIAAKRPSTALAPTSGSSPVIDRRPVTGISTVPRAPAAANNIS